MIGKVITVLIFALLIGVLIMFSGYSHKPEANQRQTRGKPRDSERFKQSPLERKGDARDDEDGKGNSKTKKAEEGNKADKTVETFQTVSLPGFGDVGIKTVSRYHDGINNILNNSTGEEPLISRICMDGACLDVDDVQSLIMTVMSKGAEIVQRLNALYDFADTNAERNRIIISEIDSMAESRKRQIAELKTRIDEMADAKREEMEELREKLRKMTEEKEENARRLKVRMRDIREDIDARMRD